MEGEGQKEKAGKALVGKTRVTHERVLTTLPTIHRYMDFFNQGTPESCVSERVIWPL